MRRSDATSIQRFQVVRELHRAREAAQLDRFLADTDPLRMASLCEEEAIQPVVSLRQWTGCRPPARRPMAPMVLLKELAAEPWDELAPEPPACRAVKFLVTCRPSDTPPQPERSVALIRAAMDWIEARLADGSMEATHFFPDRGGIAILHAESHEALLEMLAGYPAYPLYTWEVQVLADWRTGLQNAMRFLEVSQGGPPES